MSEHISVRVWQELFQAGAFHNNDLDTEQKAGWEEFYDPLHNRKLQNLVKLVLRVTHPYILDNYSVWFQNNSPACGPLYPDVRFMPLSEDLRGNYFLVSLDSPHERQKWALFTERFGLGTPEFECRRIPDMLQYINNLGRELEQGIKPPFIAEKRAVAVYSKIHGEPFGIDIYREGDHRYSYTSFKDGLLRTIMAAISLENVPSGFVAEQAEEVKGVHIYCPEEAGEPPAPVYSPYKLEDVKKHSRKKEER